MRSISPAMRSTSSVISVGQRRGRSSSSLRATSCAAPRIAASGFLISCASTAGAAQARRAVSSPPTVARPARASDIVTTRQPGCAGERRDRQVDAASVARRRPRSTGRARASWASLAASAGRRSVSRRRSTTSSDRCADQAPRAAADQVLSRRIGLARCARSGASSSTREGQRRRSALARVGRRRAARSLTRRGARRHGS